MVLLASCSGGGSAVSTPPAHAIVASSGPTTAGNVTLTIPASGATSSAKTRRPQFISPGASSVGVTINSGAVTYSDISSASPNCTTGAGGARTCTIAVTAPAGTPTILLALYDGPNGSGKMVAQGSAAPTVTLGTPFAVTVTMAPVVGSLIGGSVVYVSGTSFTAGTAGSATVTISAADPDGAPIPPGTPSFAAPVTLASNSSHVTIAPAQWTAPSHPITLTYDGSMAVSPTVLITFSSGSTSLAQIPLSVSNGGTINEYPIPTASSQPYGLTSGPDGAVWFVEHGGNQIGRITAVAPIGTITNEYAIPTVNALPTSITSGPDGNLWFTEDGISLMNNKIGRITPTGVVTEFPIPTTFSGANAITAGPDGNLWFTEENANQIGRITTAGVITEFAIPTPTAVPWSIVSGPDGALWFTEANANVTIKGIGRITTAGAVTEFTIPTAGSGSEGIAVGGDGALWFTEHGTAKVGRVTTGGAFTEYPVAASSFPLGITPGPDGALWFAEEVIGKIGRITTAGAYTDYPLSAPNVVPWGIILGPGWKPLVDRKQRGQDRTRSVPIPVTYIPIRTRAGAATLSIRTTRSSASCVRRVERRRQGR